MRVAVVSAFLALPALAATQQPPARTLVEEFRIDGAEHEFTAIGGVLPLKNGNVLVISAGDFAATIFSPSGAVVKHIGRKGAGPGEIQSLGGFGLIGDSLWLGDFALNRFTLYGLDGGVGRTTLVTESVAWTRLLPGAPEGAFTSRVLPLVLLPGDAALGMPSTLSRAMASGAVKELPLVRIRWDGTVTKVVATAPLSLSTVAITSGDRTTYTGSPFVRSARIEASRDGRQVAMIQAITEPSPVIRIVRFTNTGDTVAKYDVPYVPETIPSRAVDSAAKALAAAIRMPEKESEVRASFGNPKFYHPIENALLANDGTVWIQSRVVNKERRWTVISPAGRIVETLVMPSTNQLRWIDGVLWGTSRDVDDVPSVVRFRRR